MRIWVAVLFAGLACAADQETKLVDRLVRAQRAVERANEKSDQAARDLTAFCKTTSRELRVKPNGLMGCVVIPPAKLPDPPTGEATPATK